MPRKRQMIATLKGGADISRAAGALHDMAIIEENKGVFALAAANYAQAAQLWEACGAADLAATCMRNAERNWQAYQDKRAQDAAQIEGFIADLEAMNAEVRKRYGIGKVRR